MRPHLLSRHALVLAGALALVAGLLLPEALAARAKPPPLPGCLATGSGYGSCEGLAIPAGGSVTKVETASGRADRFTFKGPAPLQSDKPVACGESNCVYNHLDWIVGNGATVVSHCKTNDTTCTVKVPRRAPRWAVVYVRQNNEEKQLWAIWNSGKVDYEISGDITLACAGHSSCSASSRLPLADAPITVSGPKKVRTTTDDKGHWSVEVPNGSYVASPGLGGGYTVTPGRRRVKVDDHNETGVDFRACSATGLAAAGATARAAADAKLAGGSCVNGVTVRYTPGASTMTVSWQYKQVCGGVARAKGKTVTVFSKTTIPRERADTVQPGSGGAAAAAIFGTDGKLLMRIAIKSDGTSAVAQIFNESAEVHRTEFEGSFGNLGRSQLDCHPLDEDIQLKP